MERKTYVVPDLMKVDGTVSGCDDSGQNVYRVRVRIGRELIGMEKVSPGTLQLLQMVASTVNKQSRLPLARATHDRDNRLSAISAVVDSQEEGHGKQ